MRLWHEFPDHVDRLVFEWNEAREGMNGETVIANQGELVGEQTPAPMHQIGAQGALTCARMCRQNERAMRVGQHPGVQH